MLNAKIQLPAKPHTARLAIPQPAYESLTKLLQAVLTLYPTAPQEYLKGNFSRAEKVSNLHLRFACDLFDAIPHQARIAWYDLERPTDAHLKSALLRIIPHPKELI